jgi:hypothetical protein
MIDEEIFRQRIIRLYDAFDKDLSIEQSKIYYDRLKWLSVEQLDQVVDAAMDNYDKFPTIKQLIGICFNKSFMGNGGREKENYLSRYILFECYCGATLSIEREHIQKGIGSFRCPHTYYRKPVDETALIREAENVLVRMRNKIARRQRTGAEKNLLIDKAARIFEARKEQIRKLVVNADLMCNRRYDYAFVRDKCKEHKGVIVMKEQQIKPEEETLLFQFDEAE